MNTPSGTLTPSRRSPKYKRLLNASGQFSRPAVVSSAISGLCFNSCAHLGNRERGDPSASARVFGSASRCRDQPRNSERADISFGCLRSNSSYETRSRPARRLGIVIHEQYTPTRIVPTLQVDGPCSPAEMEAERNDSARETFRSVILGQLIARRPQGGWAHTVAPASVPT